jgi:hypothetical protein
MFGYEICLSGGMLHGDVADQGRFPVYNEIGECAEEEDNACKKNPEKFSAEASNTVVSLWL